MFVIVLLSVCLGLAAAAPASGTCMCVTASSVNVRNGAGLSSHVVASVSSGECYKFNGGVLIKNGYTWYELQHVHGHSGVWVASNYLSKATSSHCSGSSGGSTSHGSYATGIVSRACLHCLCVHESGCKAFGCHIDVNSDSCGYFQIKESYWVECGMPGTGWRACADDLHCASECIQNYMTRYATLSGCSMTCESFAREHNGGPKGCRHASTVSYWNSVQIHPGCHNVH